MNALDIRRKIISFCREMNRSGLNQGTSGNISARAGDAMLITPSGVPYDDLEPDMIASMALDTDKLEWQGPMKPSSEWHFHRAILKTFPSLGAVVHTHSTFATILSIGGLSIPACHYMIAAFGGNSVRCARYETFGTPELSAAILEAMTDRSACLLANHGMIAAGPTLDKAMWAAVELETLARQYYHARLLGELVVLPDDEMERVVAKFAGYGQPRPSEDRAASH